jgi:hypothetical protein
MGDAHALRHLRVHLVSVPHCFRTRLHCACDRDGSVTGRLAGAIYEALADISSTRLEKPWNKRARFRVTHAPHAHCAALVMTAIDKCACNHCICAVPYRGYILLGAAFEKTHVGQGTQGWSRRWTRERTGQRQDTDSMLPPSRKKHY